MAGADEAQKILSVLRQRGSYTVIYKITVNLNIKKDSYEAEFSNLGIKSIPISEEYPTKFDQLLCFKDKGGIQIMKDYMASGSFARGKEEKAVSASMVFVGNINQGVDVLLKTSSLFDPFQPEMGTDTAFLDRIHCYVPG